jgi:hypothetical protein
MTFNKNRLDILQNSMFNSDTRLPKETALIAGQRRTLDFPVILFASHGRCIKDAIKKRLPSNWT